MLVALNQYLNARAFSLRRPTQKYTMIISLIAAMSTNRAIGLNNKLPWPHIPADWANLERVTANKMMIMGRKSYDSPDRVWSKVGNVVVSRQSDYPLDAGFELASSLPQAIEMVRGQAEVFILGGEEIFRQSMALADRIYLTLVHGIFEGDAFFPDIDHAVFGIATQTHHQADAQNPLDYSFVVYERRQ